MLPIKRILAPTDFSKVSIETVKNARELARHFGAELLIVHVIPPIPALPADPHYNFELPAYQDALKDHAEERMKETLSDQVFPDLPTRTLISYGDPAREIVRIAQSEKSDLIVIATHGLTGWQHLVFGSVAEKVVRRAACPVLTVHCLSATSEESEAGVRSQSDN